MNDKRGKPIKVGNVVRTSEGKVLRVAGVLGSALEAHPAASCEVIDTFVGGKDGGVDEGDTIIWGT